MKCKAVHKKLIFFLDGDLPEAGMKQVQQHINRCDNCAAFAADMRKTLDMLEEEKTQEANPFFYTRVKARLKNEQEKIYAPEKRPVLVKVLQPVFFTVLLLFGIYSGFKIAQTASEQYAGGELQEEVIPYLNEMEEEPIEAFLME
ncbi:MAG: anti-sigma factor family protein [Prolixibacteraceae bacterium]